jgi:HSP20 family protein
MWTEACLMLERTERLQRQFFQPELSPSRAGEWEPPVDVLETKDQLCIIVALPGVSPPDVDVSINDGVLSIVGVRHRPAIAGSASIHRLEIPYGRFERRIRLASGRLSIERSELSNGCLILELTKKA